VESLPRPPVRVFFLLDFRSLGSRSKAPTPFPTSMHPPSLLTHRHPISSMTHPSRLCTLPIRCHTMAIMGIRFLNTLSIHCRCHMPTRSTSTRRIRRVHTTTTVWDTTPHHRRRRTRRQPQRPAHTHYPRAQARSAPLQKCERPRSPSAALSPPSQVSARCPCPGQVPAGEDAVR